VIETVEDAVTEEIAEPVLDPEKSPFGKGKGFRAWLSGEGSRYKTGLKGATNWLGDTVGLFLLSISLVTCL
jgi:hypothetical protein